MSVHSSLLDLVLASFPDHPSPSLTFRCLQYCCSRVGEPGNDASQVPLEVMEFVPCAM